METVVEAWRKALPNLPTGAKLLIQGVVGDETYFDTLKRQIATLNLADSIELGRGVPAEQLKELYRTSRFMVFPPIGENCPITLLEAMRIGIPIIGTKADPVPEICGAAALYFEDRDSDACALNITNLFNIPELAAEMSDLGQERSRDFSWDVSAQRTAEHILQVCESSYEHHSDEALARKSVAKNIP
jgi:glycosyltransferase involved in cell wall biosynthesis